MDAARTNAGGVYIERGGPAYRLMQRIGLIRGDDPSIGRRIVAFLAVTYIPLLVLSIWEGHAIGPTPQTSLLLDFAAYARFFLAVPILFIAEVTIGPRVTTAGLHFVESGLVRSQDQPAFDRAVQRLARWRESWSVELVLLAIAVAGAWIFTAEDLYGAATVSTWNDALTAADQGRGLSSAGLWYRMVSVPILQFFWYRWLWRLGIWGWFLYDVSRLKLNLVPTHADGAGGLAFLGTTHVAFGILAFGMSCVLSAAAAFDIVFEGAGIDSFRVHFITLVVITEVLLLSPLLMFTPALIGARLTGLRQYSLLVLRYNRAFHDKWIAGQVAPDEPLLGSSDIQSLADLGNSYEFIRSMRIVPFTVRVMLQLAVISLLPALPLILLVMPIEQVLKIMTQALL